MRQAECSRCNAMLPESQIFDVLGYSVCEPCANEIIAERKQEIGGGDPERPLPETVCRWCELDSGTALPTVCELPICPSCESRIRNYPFPTWIKVSFVGLVVLGIASFIYNYRFADSLFAARRAMKAAAAGDLDAAAARMERAATLVPEVAEFREQADMFHGIQLLRDDRSKEAIPLLLKMLQKAPDNRMVRHLVLQAEIGAAFDDKHYDVMLEKTKELVELTPDDPMAKFGLASAYGCRYAETGEKGFKDKALELFAEAEKSFVPGGAMDEAAHENFRQRILYRLSTRDIIDKKQFDERFPQGWKGNGVEKTE